MRKKSFLKIFTLKCALLHLLFLWVAIPLFAQTGSSKNLVPNPSFEIHKNRRGDINSAAPWIGVGTVDYYLKPEKRDTSRFKGARTGT